MPYMEHEIGEIIDFGDEKNQSLVDFQRAVWVKEEKKKPTKKTTKTTTKTEDGASESKEDLPARGEDGRFVSKK